MGRTLDEVMSTLPEERRERIDARFQELKDEVEGLGELAPLAGTDPEAPQNRRVQFRGE